MSESSLTHNTKTRSAPRNLCDFRSRVRIVHRVARASKPKPTRCEMDSPWPTDHGSFWATHTARILTPLSPSAPLSQKSTDRSPVLQVPVPLWCAAAASNELPVARSASCARLGVGVLTEASMLHGLLQVLEVLSCFFSAFRGLRPSRVLG